MLVFLKNKGFNTFAAILLFYFLFLFLAPLYQLNERVSFWGRPFPEISVFAAAKFLSTIFLLTYVLIYKSLKLKVKIRKHQLRKYSIAKIYVVSLVCGFIVLDYYNFKIVNFIFRNVSDASFQNEGPMYLIISKFLRPLPVVLWYTLKIHTERKLSLTDIIPFLYLIIVLFPTGIPRFLSGTIYLSLGFIFIAKNLSARSWILGIVGSIIIAFPLLNKFRYDNNSLDYLNSNVFLTEDFDSFSSIYETINYEEYSLGNQLIGSFLFWLPRSVWAQKPVGSGRMLAEDLNYSYNNVSVNYIAEGYLNFGIGGVILFAIILGIYSRYVDRSMAKNTSIWPVIFSFQLLFIMRGDLMSSIAFTVSLYVCYRVSKIMLLYDISNQRT